MKASFIKRMTQDKVSLGLAITLFVLIVLRIAILPISPPGFYIDEVASSVHAQAMVDHHTNAQGQSWPLYSHSLGGGFTTPVYLYPVSAWAGVFGSGPLSMRAFSQFITILAVALTALVVRLWLGKRAALIAGVVGLALPWNWLQGSLAWDPVIVPLVSALAFAGWSLLYSQTLKSRRIAGYITLPLGLVLLAYVYPPYWAVAPILFVSAYLSLYLLKRIGLRPIILTVLFVAVAVIPLALFIISPGTLGRSSSVSIFYHHTLIEAIGLFIKNIFLLINPFFLFIYGDFNQRQSTGPQGMLGLASLIPMMVLVIALIRDRGKKIALRLVKKNERMLVVIATAGYTLSLIGSALTNEGQPHSLRACSAWIFAVVIITVAWLVILRSRRTWLKWTAITVFIVGTLIYCIDLAYFYPIRSANSFHGSFDITRRILQDHKSQSTPRKIHLNNV